VAFVNFSDICRLLIYNIHYIPENWTPLFLTELKVSALSRLFFDHISVVYDMCHYRMLILSVSCLTTIEII
jgi:hypothetical protein